jgi:hypothetical protein
MPFPHRDCADTGIAAIIVHTRPAIPRSNSVELGMLSPPDLADLFSRGEAFPQ